MKAKYIQPSFMTVPIKIVFPSEKAFSLPNEMGNIYVEYPQRK